MVFPRPSTHVQEQPYLVLLNDSIDAVRLIRMWFEQHVASPLFIKACSLKSTVSRSMP